VDVIVGNPPFLGDKKMRGELGDEYVNALRKLYEGRVPGGADLVCYWYEKARTHIEQGKAKRAGLLATNSIRDGSSNKVLQSIKKTGDIFMAWSDRDWILNGAAVRVSMVGFDNGAESKRVLDGQTVGVINSDLTAKIDVNATTALSENSGLCFLGMMKAGPFDIDAKTAQEMLMATNASSKSNRDVVKPRMNGQDITGKPSNTWIIDFGVSTSEQEASLYEMPFKYVYTHVKPVRDNNRDERMNINWWLYGRPRPNLREAIQNLKRCIVTPEVAKHRIFVWLDTNIIPDHTLHVVARDDDYMFGVLHSHVHEVWSLSIGSWMGKGNDPRYSSSRTFENFPFPWSPGQEDIGSAEYAAIAAAAKCLHEERAAWLNPPGASEKDLKDRTLTNLYNALNVWRGKEKMKVKDAAGDFAPRLDELHTALDRAVVAAYGWPEAVLADEEDILRRLLALNLERAARQGADTEA
ncbi:MAG TPA: DNA methyltransferase, partial [Phototrophicaceae bacterium]|nr:DNA methyltransferase [Phototrophicaceae bacterium]